jgi:hypothetical protein
MTSFDVLTAEFADWIAAPDQARIADVGDALEIRMFGDVTKTQGAWLDDFIARWDAMESARDQA